MSAAVLRAVPQRALPWLLRLAQLALALAILWLLAGLVWRALTPAPAVRPVAATLEPADAAAHVAAANLFGAATAASASAPAPARADIQLRGVIAAKGKKRAVAIVSVNGGEPQVVAEGESIGAGLTLDRVYSERIDVTSITGRQSVELAR